MSTEKAATAVKAASEKSRPSAPASGAPGGVPKWRKYLEEVQTELRKVTWPTKAELIAQTQVVLGLLALILVIIFVWDTLLGFAVRGLMRLIGVSSA